MKKIKNKFIIGVVALIIFVLALQILLANRVDRNSYVTLVDGVGYIYIDGEKLALIKQEKKKLDKGNVIETSGDESLAIIEWGDGSITRLGANSRIEVKNNFASKSLDKIQISFELQKGKSWSNVINFIGEESYFKEYYADTEAAVRGTVFELNLDKNYLYVNKHEVSIKKSNGKQIVVSENNPFDIKTFSFISLEKFLLDIRDKAWQKLNKKFDKEFFEKLKRGLLELDRMTQEKKKELSQKVSNISSMTQKQKQELYSDIVQNYQKLNFVKPDDLELYKQKLFYKDLFIKIAPEKDKQSLLRSSLFEFKQLVKSSDIEAIKQTLNIFTSNKKYINSEDFEKYFDFEMLPESLKSEFEKQYRLMYDFLKISFGTVGEKTKDLQQKAKEFSNDTKEFLNDLINK